MAELAMAESRLPWARDPAERLTFVMIVCLMLLAFAVPAWLISGMDLPERDRETAEKLPPQLARLIQAKKEPKVVPEVEPAQPEVPAAPKPEPEPVAKPDQPAPAARPAEPAWKPAAVDNPSSSQTTEQARESASRSGLFAMQSQLSALAAVDDAPAVSRRKANTSKNIAVPAATANQEARVLAGSGGVSDQLAPVQDVVLAEHRAQAARIPAEQTTAIARNEGPPRHSGGERAMSNIRQVFDAQKSVLYSIYQRELRRDPTLEGQLTLELVIEPDGSVSECRVVGSELAHAMLEQRIAMRVQMFNFGAADVDTRTVRFPIDFLPG
ncbi:hypothetical protein C7H09_17500 [Marinobacter fuscus]|uniref:TonB C-terminal domain-containing protein n=1 Tax=Marinobacter fuscus TaxID=2109942 RepID=A0A2T1K421_9GAMM|nr:AgmX/PglI C-terminal domain-containing protein [Marinobacter fuscus]PSF04825.1 hypothetical protein C7H09_17500 [Marinobacter fuscus]